MTDPLDKDRECFRCHTLASNRTIATPGFPAVCHDATACDLRVSMAKDRARYAAIPEREMCPDPTLGTREGWAWCADCAAIQPPFHAHWEWGEVQLEAPAYRAIHAEQRATFAESLLFALGWDHFALCAKFYGMCDPDSGCVFCDAARKP
jgi:hypothetical protein